MAQWLRTLTDLAEDLKLVPSTYMAGSLQEIWWLLWASWTHSTHKVQDMHMDGTSYTLKYNIGLVFLMVNQINCQIQIETTGKFHVQSVMGAAFKQTKDNRRSVSRLKKGPLTHTCTGMFAFKEIGASLVYSPLLSKCVWASTMCHVVLESSGCRKRWKLKTVIISFAGEYHDLSRCGLNSPLRVPKSPPTFSLFNCPFYCHWHNLLSFQYHKREVLSLFNLSL